MLYVGLWKERNSRMFAQKSLDFISISKLISPNVEGWAKASLGKKREDFEMAFHFAYIVTLFSRGHSSLITFFIFLPFNKLVGSLPKCPHAEGFIKKKSATFT